VGGVVSVCHVRSCRSAARSSRCSPRSRWRRAAARARWAIRADRRDRRPGRRADRPHVRGAALGAAPGGGDAPRGRAEEEIAKLRADGLERLIESRLVEKIVEDSNSKATDEEITRTIEGIAKENGLTVEQLYASVVFHGLTVDEYRAQIKRDFERRNVVQGMLGSA
jgi:parvulin-like peptidyl-prolyl isomerase